MDAEKGMRFKKNSIRIHFVHNFIVCNIGLLKELQYKFNVAADPNFYSMNLLMIGKTYLRMNKKELALEYLTRAHQYPVKTEDDKQVGIGSTIQ